MTKPVLPKYYTVRHGRGYWELGPKRARLSGMKAYIALGVDGPETRDKARELYRKYKKAIQPPPKPAPPPKPVKVPIVILPAKPGLLLQFVIDHTRHEGLECLIPPVKVIGASGYIHIKSCGRQIGAHRLMLLLARGEEYFNGAWAGHRCGNPSCVNPQHLYWTTPRQNGLDRQLHGTVHMGKRSKPGPLMHPLGIRQPDQHQKQDQRAEVVQHPIEKAAPMEPPSVF